MESWDSVELHDWTHYSGELGERVYRVRRVRLVPNKRYPDTLAELQGLMRVEWYNPEDSGTSFEWETFGTFSVATKGNL